MENVYIIIYYVSYCTMTMFKDFIAEFEITSVSIKNRERLKD